MFRTERLRRFKQCCCLQVIHMTVGWAVSLIFLPLRGVVESFQF